MKKFFVAVLLLVLITASPVFADRTCTSGNKTGAANGLIVSGAGYLEALQVTPDANDVTVTLYDNASAASGTVIASWKAKGSVNPESKARLFNGVWFENGIYYATTQTGATVNVDYRTANGRCD